jgi:DNA-binding YbaB/EbfC family protein
MTTAAKGSGFQGVVKQAQKMQQQITRVQDQLADREIEATVAGGAVLAVVNGKQELVRLKFDAKEIEKATTEELEELVTAAVNLALTNAREMLQTEVNRITGGLSIPGLL